MQKRLISHGSSSLYITTRRPKSTQTLKLKLKHKNLSDTQTKRMIDRKEDRKKDNQCQSSLYANYARCVWPLNHQGAPLLSKIIQVAYHYIFMSFESCRNLFFLVNDLYLFNNCFGYHAVRQIMTWLWLNPKSPSNVRPWWMLSSALILSHIVKPQNQVYSRCTLNSSPNSLTRFHLLFQVNCIGLT